MSKASKKKKLKIKNILIAVVILVTIIICIPKVINFSKNLVTYNNYYLSSHTNTVTIYTFDEEENIMTEEDNVYRGKKVKSNDKTKTIGDITYKEIKIDEEI